MGLIDSYRLWKERRAVCRELDVLGPEGRAALARDIFVSEEVLARVAAARVTPPTELPRLMRLLGLEPADVERQLSGVMRDMRVVCAGCADARRCDADLATGDSHLVESYCPHATTLNALRHDALPRPTG